MTMQTPSPQAPPKSIGLALSGGGARGYAHIGVLKALEEYHIKPTIIAGVSAGSIIGALYCKGLCADEIEATLRSRHISSYIEPILSLKSIFTAKKLKRFLESEFGNTQIEELPVPLIIVATDILNGIAQDFTQGPICKVIGASCSIPALFPPVKINSTPYVDGGVLKNFPVSNLIPHCELVIGSNVNPSECMAKPYKENLLAITERAYKLIIRSNARADSMLCDLLIEPEELVHFSIFDTQNSDKIIEVGYRNTMERLPQFIEANNLTP